MKLRWKKQYEKVWVDFTHDDGSKDGRYAQEETGERTLQFFNESNGQWEDVPREE